MAWVRIDDRFDEHPKVMAAGPEAMWVLFRALAFANRGETDGHVPAVALSRIGSDFGPKKRRTLMDTLVDVDLAHRPGHDCDRCPQPADGWQIHDYADYQPTRKQKDAERAEARERMAKARAKKRPRSADVRTEHEKNRSGSSDNPVPDPGPVPDPEDAGSGGSGVHGKGGVRGGAANFEQIRLEVAYELADCRIEQGYPAESRDAFARHLVKTDIAVESEARRRWEAEHPVSGNVRELLDRIAKPIDGQEEATG